MPNMQHCRFHNTFEDLMECYEHMDDKDLSAAEQRERRRLIQICCAIAHEFGEED